LKFAVRLRTAAALWVLALLAHLPVFLALREPGTMDATYYLEVARNLAAGRGLVEDFTWSWLASPGGLPHPACLYWMPGESVLVAGFLRVLGDTFGVAQVPGLILGSVLPVLAWYLGRRLGSRTAAWMGFLLALFPGWGYALSTTTDTLGLFGVLGGGVLLLCGRPGARAILAAGALTAMAVLVRVDGVLLLAPVLWVGIASPLPLCGRGSPPQGAGRGGGGERGCPGGAGEGAQTRRRSAAVGAAAVLVLGVFGAWMARNAAILHGPAFGKVTFLREYTQLFSTDPDGQLTWSGFLDWGIGRILGSRLEGLGTALFTRYGLPGAFGIVFAPLVAWGAWVRRRDLGPFVPAGIYVLALIAVGVLVYPVVLERGTLLHGLAPATVFGGVLVGLALDDLSRRRGLDPRFLLLLAGGAAAVISGVSAARLLSTQGRTTAQYASVGPMTGDATVMTDDPIAWHYATGAPAVVTPWDDAAVIARMARENGARFLVLRETHPPALDRLWDGVADDPDWRRVAETVGVQVYGLRDED